MKKCPFCAEDIQDEAQKCKHCKEFLTKNNCFELYEKWLKQNYPAYTIVSRDAKENSIILHKTYKAFNIIIFIVLLLLWVLPGLIYAAVTLLKGSIITLTIYFDEEGKVIRVSNDFKFLMKEFNKQL